MSKPIWIALFIFSGVMALWWGGLAGRDLFHYMRLRTEIPAQIEGFEILPKGTKYAVRALYSYGERFTGSTTFSKPYHLNRAAAEAEVDLISGMQWSAWVDPSHPEISSLQKKFPLKTTIYAGVLIAVFFYFCALYWIVHLSTKE